MGFNIARGVQVGGVGGVGFLVRVLALVSIFRTAVSRLATWEAIIFEDLVSLPFSVYSRKISRRSSKRNYLLRDFIILQAYSIKSLASRILLLVRPLGSWGLLSWGSWVLGSFGAGP